MGPPTVVDGEQQLMILYLQRHLRFNGAADCRRRREAEVLGREHHDVTLQWGRRLSSTESRGQRKTPASIISLQWGRRLSSTERHIVVGIPLGLLMASMGPPTVVDGE